MKIAYWPLDFMKVRDGTLYINVEFGFIIAKEKWEWDKIELYGRRIKNFLGIEGTDFYDWID